MAVGRPVAARYLRPQAPGRRRLLRPTEDAHRDERAGVRIGELLAAARQASRQVLDYSDHDARDNGHETAAYMVQTDAARRAAGLSRASAPWFRCSRCATAAVWPAFCRPYIVLTQPQGRFSESGFLGSKYKPFATGGDPSQQRFNVEGLVAEGINRKAPAGPARAGCAAQHARPRRWATMPRFAAARQAEKQAYDLILARAPRPSTCRRNPPSSATATGGRGSGSHA